MVYHHQYLLNPRLLLTTPPDICSILSPIALFLPWLGGSFLALYCSLQTVPPSWEEAVTLVPRGYTSTTAVIYHSPHHSRSFFTVNPGCHSFCLNSWWSQHKWNHTPISPFLELSSSRHFVLHSSFPIYSHAGPLLFPGGESFLLSNCVYLILYHFFPACFF